MVYSKLQVKSSDATKILFLINTFLIKVFDV